MQYTEIDIFDLPEMHQPILDKNKTVKLGTFFSGYDSQYMAMERLSKKGINTQFECISEIDKTALKVHRLLFGEIKNLGAVGSFEKIPPNLDIATWSFPCQDISLAGNQKGMTEGTRSNYGFVFLDTLENTPYHERPKVLLMENVKALASDKFQDQLNEIKYRLKSMGYDNHIAVLNSKHFLIPQNRERLFIVSILGGGYFEFPKPKKLVKRLRDVKENNVAEGYYLKAKTLVAMLTNSSEHYDRKSKFLSGITDGDGIARTITTHVVRPESNYFSTEEIISYGRYRATGHSGSKVLDPNGIAPTFMEHHGHIDALIEGVKIPDSSIKGYSIAQDGDGCYINRPYQKSGVVQKGMIPTIKTQGHDIGIVEENQDQHIDYVIEAEFEDGTKVVTIGGKAHLVTPNGKYFRVRKITPREALRLMDVEEKYIDIIVNNVSKTQVYKLAGNSIVVNVLVSIIEQLF